MYKIFLFIYFSFVIADIPEGYYDEALGLSGNALRSALHEIIDNHIQQSYSSLHEHFEITDIKPNGCVWDIYSDVPSGDPAYQYFFIASDQCGNYSDEGDCYNKEHSWPKSWFNEAYPMNSDLFHIYPTDGSVNSYRGSLPYGDVNIPNWTSTNGSKRGICANEGYNNLVFEPIDEYKGDIARTYFYMSTRYFNEDSSWDDTDMTNGAEIKDWALSFLINWHLLDPVSNKEINRNDNVYFIQNNRNPFIDHPEWVECIWTEFCELSLHSSIDKINNNVKITSLYKNSSILLELDFLKQYNIEITVVSLLGRTVDHVYNGLNNIGKNQWNYSIINSCLPC